MSDLIVVAHIFSWDTLRKKIEMRMAKKKEQEKRDQKFKDGEQRHRFAKVNISRICKISKKKQNVKKRSKLLTFLARILTFPRFVVLLSFQEHRGDAPTRETRWKKFLCIVKYFTVEHTVQFFSRDKKKKKTHTSHYGAWRGTNYFAIGGFF